MVFTKRLKQKKALEIQNESMTMATITFQNYFRMYEKLSGMTGTAKTEEEEFRNIYNMNVIVIPTNKPIARDDRARFNLCNDGRKVQSGCRRYR